MNEKLKKIRQKLDAIVKDSEEFKLKVIPMKEKVYDVSGTPPQQLVGVSKTNKKLTSVLKKRNISLLNRLNEKDEIDPEKFKEPPSVVFPLFAKSKCSSLSLSLRFSLHHRNTPAPP